MGSEQQFCLRWHNYQSSLLASLPLLLDGDDLTDVTLMAGGCNLKAHRVVLSACSQYFKELFRVLQPLHHPVIVLPGTKFTDLCALVTFMYSGEVNIYQEQLQGLLAMADALQIRGLAEVNGNSAKCNNTLNPISLKEDEVQPAAKRTKTSSHSTLNNNKAQNASRTLKHKADGDVYGCLVEGLRCFNSKQMSGETDCLSKINKTSSDTFKTKTPTCMKNVSNQVFCQMGTNLLSYINDKSHVASKTFSKEAKSADKNLQLPESNIKIEEATRTLDANVVMELDSVLRNTSHSSLEEMELAAAKMCVSQGGLSPSSESALDSMNVDFTTERINLNQSKALPSHYNKQWSSTQANNKLFATCFVCGKQLSNQYNLRVHMETHQNVNYACSVCSHVSRSRDALRKHVSYRHPGEAKEKSGVVEKQADGVRNTGEVGDGHMDAGNKSKTDPNGKLTSNP